jgi:hypothetical protein
MLQITKLHATVGDKPILKARVFALLLVVSTTPAHAAEEGPKPIIDSKIATGSVIIPDEIAPAVIPYLDCLTNAVNRGIGPKGVGTVDEVRAIEANAVTECRPVRKTAATNADGMYKKYNKKLDAAGRAASIEKTLVEIENMATNSSKMMEQFLKDAEAKAKTDASTP